MLKQLTQTGIGILGIYLIIVSLSNLANKTFGISYQAEFSDYMMQLSTPTILFIGGILCIKFRIAISLWLNNDSGADVSFEIDMDRLECIAYSIIGILTLINSISYVIMSYTNYFIKPLVKMSGSTESALRSYAYVQLIGATLVFSLALILISFPNRIRALLKITRGF